MKECLRCGNEDVTETFHRVNCNNEGELWWCVECQANGRPLRGPDDDRSSSRYDQHLDKIRAGKSLKEIRGES